MARLVRAVLGVGGSQGYLMVVGWLVIEAILGESERVRELVSLVDIGCDICKLLLLKRKKEEGKKERKEEAAFYTLLSLA